MARSKKEHKYRTVNILVCGTGGQGVLTASEVCGWAALYDGRHVKKSEVHGMAQRGGSVESHLRYGKEVFSPLIPYGQADYLLAFDADEGRRLAGFLAKTGYDFTPELESARKAVNSPRFMNIYLIGRLSRSLDIKEKSWIKAIERVFREKSPEENRRMFLKGRGGAE